MITKVGIKGFVASNAVMAGLSGGCILSVPASPHGSRGAEELRAVMPAGVPRSSRRFAADDGQSLQCAYEAFRRGRLGQGGGAAGVYAVEGEGEEAGCALR
ncbi:hypothetical protein Vqi01_59280 [Micromonospora qiuiae]|uniref:Uncharacterized protein n=1 Tax=Micromonospora qiuiae TaxID=502268 RepID=A0ABQ4JJI8_9ACTN|nr:hypothetical protein Vqi01_59280 [Micromonospora qiuiae]